MEQLGLGAGIGGAVVGFLSYLAARRAASGRIETTEARDLWEEAARLRSALQSERDMLRTEVATVRQEATQQRREYELKIDALQQLVDRSREQIDRLQDEINALRRRVIT